MSNIIDSIQLSGTVYTIGSGGGGGGITSGEVQTMIDESISGKVDTSAVVTAVTSGSTDSEIPTAKAVYDAIPTGGSASYSAGRGINIANDTISISLPISAGTGSVSIIEGYETQASGSAAHAEGHTTSAIANRSHAEGYKTSATSVNSHAEGYNTITTNENEHASGYYNVSSSASTTLGNSGNTLFSVGNGTSTVRHNAFEIRQNGDIYLTYNGNNVKLQDQLGGGGGNPTVELTQAEYDALVTAGTVASNTYYIITDAVGMNVTSTVTSGSTDVVTSGGVYDQLGGLKLLQITQSAYDILTTKDPNTLYVIVN